MAAEMAICCGVGFFKNFPVMKSIGE
jgi:hypothetical protein